MKKRGKGISPLIATVLLIGFAVVVAVTVWMWYGNIIQGQFMKQGAISEIETACLSDIDLQITGASETANGISIDIKNSGNKVFNGVRVIVNGGEEVLSEKETFNPTEQKSITVKTSIASVDFIEVMPMIVRQGVPGTCTDKKVKSSLE